jgi:hypothetical protein
MPDSSLNIRNHLAGIGLIQVPIQVLRGTPELDNKIIGEIPRFKVAALFLPEPQQGSFVIAHNNPSVRAADERAPIGKFVRAIHDTPPSGSARINDCMHGFVDVTGRASVIGARTGLVKQLASAMVTSVAWVRAGGKCQLPIGSRKLWYNQYADRVKGKGHTKKEAWSPGNRP